LGSDFAVSIHSGDEWVDVRTETERDIVAQIGDIEKTPTVAGELHGVK